MLSTYFSINVHSLLKLLSTESRLFNTTSSKYKYLFFYILNVYLCVHNYVCVHVCQFLIGLDVCTRNVVTYICIKFCSSYCYVWKPVCIVLLSHCKTVCNANTDETLTPKIKLVRSCFLENRWKSVLKERVFYLEQVDEYRFVNEVKTS